MLIVPEIPKALVTSTCDKLKLLARGKVRDIYALPDSEDALLFVATDRVSAFDVIMKNVLASPLSSSLALALPYARNRAFLTKVNC